MPTAEDTSSYSIEDEQILKASKKMYDFFIEDKTEFVSFDSSFDDPYAEKWLAKINDCFEITDIKAQNRGEKLSYSNRSKTEDYRQSCYDLRYYVKIAFPNRDDIISSFGFDNYSQARKDPVKMIELIDMLYINAVKYADKLIPAGYTKGKIAGLKVLQEELIAQNYINEINEKKRAFAIKECFDECCNFMHKTSNAGKLIFASNPLKYNRYLMPGEKRNKSDAQFSPDYSPFY